jgi:polysaccharide export outer membrane protein
MNTIEKAMAMNLSRALVLLIIVSFTAQGGWLQTPREKQSTGTPSSGTSSQPAGRATSVLVSPDEDYRIGLNDVLDIRVESSPELTQTYRVTAAGTFLMPWIGRVTAVNKTPEQLAQYIADKLRGDYLKDPKVSVMVKEFNSRSFFVQGSVKSPGVYQIEGRPTLLELITLAGGLADNHGSTAFIIRRIKKQAKPVEAEPAADTGSTNATVAGEGRQDPEGPKYEMRTANINGLLKGRFDQDVAIEPGDNVNIPPTDIFFVAGEVKAPGSFPLKDGTTLRQAISLAQGTNFKAASGRTLIFREDSNGKQEEMKVDLAKVMDGKAPDVPIRANDMIIVPNSRMKSIGGTLLNAFGLTTITRVPIP